MAGLRFTDLQSRPMEFLDFTSLTLDEFQVLVPPFETAFQVRMAAWRFDGKPRTARRFTVYRGLCSNGTALLLDSRVLRDQQLNERRKQRFASLADVVHEFEEPQVDREFLLGNAPMRTQPTA
jgi:hypothetical protein